MFVCECVCLCVSVFVNTYATHRHRHTKCPYIDTCCNNCASPPPPLPPPSSSPLSSYSSYSSYSSSFLSKRAHTHTYTHTHTSLHTHTQTYKHTHTHTHVDVHGIVLVRDGLYEGCFTYGMRTYTHMNQYHTHTRAHTHICVQLISATKSHCNGIILTHTHTYIYTHTYITHRRPPARMFPYAGVSIACVILTCDISVVAAKTHTGVDDGGAELHEGTRR